MHRTPTTWPWVATAPCVRGLLWSPENFSPSPSPAFGFVLPLPSLAYLQADDEATVGLMGRHLVTGIIHQPRLGICSGGWLSHLFSCLCFAVIYFLIIIKKGKNQKIKKRNQFFSSFFLPASHIKSCLSSLPNITISDSRFLYTGGLTTQFIVSTRDTLGRKGGTIHNGSGTRSVSWGHLDMRPRGLHCSLACWFKDSLLPFFGSKPQYTDPSKLHFPGCLAHQLLSRFEQ